MIAPVENEEARFIENNYCSKEGGVDDNIRNSYLSGSHTFYSPSRKALDFVQDALSRPSFNKTQDC